MPVGAKPAGPTARPRFVAALAREVAQAEAALRDKARRRAEAVQERAAELAWAQSGQARELLAEFLRD